MRYFVTLGGREIPVDVTLRPDGTWEVFARGRAIVVEAVSAGRALSLRIEGRVVDLVVEGTPPSVTFTASGRRGLAQIESERTRTSALRAPATGGDSLVVSPMPGRVIKVLVEAGQEVEVGAPLVVVEAMKMENELRAGRAGRIAKVFVSPGDAVEGGAKLVAIAS